MGCLCDNTLIIKWIRLLFQICIVFCQTVAHAWIHATPVFWWSTRMNFDVNCSKINTAMFSEWFANFLSEISMILHNSHNVANTSKALGTCQRKYLKCILPYSLADIKFQDSKSFLNDYWDHRRRLQPQTKTLQRQWSQWLRQNTDLVKTCKVASTRNSNTFEVRFWGWKRSCR